MARLLVFSLKGTDSLPPFEPVRPRELTAQPELANAAVVAQGKATYHQYCGACHGDTAVSGGVLPDLRYSAAASDPKLWQSIAHDGALQARGMIAFGEELRADQIETVRAYVVHRINESLAEEHRATGAAKN